MGSSSTAAGYRSCTPTQSSALDPLLAPVSGVGAVLALLALFVYPGVRGRQRRRRRQQGQRPHEAGAPLAEPLLEGGGLPPLSERPRAHASLQQLPSRRLKLLVAFSCLTMLLGAGRCLLRLSRCDVLIAGGCGWMLGWWCAHWTPHSQNQERWRQRRLSRLYRRFVGGAGGPRALLPVRPRTKPVPVPPAPLRVATGGAGVLGQQQQRGKAGTGGGRVSFVVDEPVVYAHECWGVCV